LPRLPPARGSRPTDRPTNHSRGVAGRGRAATSGGGRRPRPAQMASGFIWCGGGFGFFVLLGLLPACLACLLLLLRARGAVVTSTAPLSPPAGTGSCNGQGEGGKTRRDEPSRADTSTPPASATRRGGWRSAPVLLGTSRPRAPAEQSRHDEERGQCATVPGADPRARDPAEDVPGVTMTCGGQPKYIPLK
jgi:hypothetical protein